MSTINLAIECGDTGLWYGRIIEHLGTHARTQTRNELLTVLREEFVYYCAWLERHGFNMDRTEPDNWNIKEELEGIGELGESGGEVALFEFDKREVTSDILEEAICKMVFNRQELLDLCQGVDMKILRKIPPEKKRSIEDILQHVCNAEEFYISRLGKEADDIYEHYLGIPVVDADKLPILKRLDVVRTACIKSLNDIIPAKGDAIFYREEYTNYPEEKWTTYKVLRRFLEHEREHIYNIRDYLKIPARPAL
ncbi:MAG: DinB family protein [Candidatus Thorarchaeota archaeon]